MPSALLIPVYLAVILLPLALAWAQGRPPRPFADELSSGLALVGFAVLLVEFVLSGRFQPVSGKVGMDVTMRFHQLTARTVAVVVLVHPALYTTPMREALPWDTSGLSSLGLGSLSLITGMLAWVLLLLLVFSAIYRDALPMRYERWRLLHGLGAALVAGFGAHHAIAAGRYSGDMVLAGLWLVLLGLAGLSLLVVYVLQPLRERRSPYRVKSVQPIAERTIEVVIAPEHGEAIDFEAGQFVWLNVGRSVFTLYENPFSIASWPGQRSELAFVIKLVGDGTRRLAQAAPGDRAYLDGPHGAATLEGRQGVGLALIAGGVGVAPMLSILRQLRHLGDRRPVKLVYGNRLREQIVYDEELKAMAGELDLEVVHVLSEPPPGWQGHTGMIGATLLEELFGFAGANGWLYVVCGPPPMIEAVEDGLADLGIRRHQIVSEKFSYD